MSQQALELGIEILIVLDAIKVVTLRHPFNLQNGKSYRQRIMLEHFFSNCFRWSNHRTDDGEVVVKLLAEAFEQVNVLRLFTGKLQQRAHAVVVAAQLWPRMID